MIQNVKSDRDTDIGRETTGSYCMRIDVAGLVVKYDISGNTVVLEIP